MINGSQSISGYGIVTSRATEQKQNCQNDTKSVAFFNIEWKKWVDIRLGLAIAIVPQLQSQLPIVTTFKHDEGKALIKLFDKEVQHQKIPFFFPVSLPNNSNASVNMDISTYIGNSNNNSINTPQKKVSEAKRKARRSRSRSNEAGNSIVNNHRVVRSHKIVALPIASEFHEKHARDRMNKKQQEEDWDDDLLGNHSNTYIQKKDGFTKLDVGFTHSDSTESSHKAGEKYCSPRHSDLRNKLNRIKSK